jgi:hypothetical protein
MHSEFHIPDFIIPHLQRVPKKSYPIKGMRRMYILQGDYAVNKLGVCLNPVPVYTFPGNLTFIHLAVAQFLDGKLSFDVHYVIKGESYNGYAAFYTNRQVYLSVKCAFKVQLAVAIESLSESFKINPTEQLIKLAG